MCSGECDNINVMSGHTGAIVQLTFNQSGDTIYTASVDKTIGMFDSMTGQRIKRMKGGVATQCLMRTIAHYSGISFSRPHQFRE